MRKSNAKLPATLISLLLLSGCASTPSNIAPEPYYPSCDTVRHLNGDVPDIVWQDVKEMVVVMEQIRETMPKDEQPRFGECSL